MTKQDRVPVNGVNLEFISLVHPVGFGTTEASRRAKSSVQFTYYPKEENTQGAPPFGAPFLKFFD